MVSIDSKEFVKPEPFCSFCLRERPSDTEFYKHVIGCSQDLQYSLQSMLGYDFNLANFAICKPCWKVMQLIQDFRLRCFKANEVVQRVSRGLTVEDGWFSAKNLATIESVRMTIADQMQQIGKINVVRRTLVLDDSTDDMEVASSDHQAESEDSEGYQGSTDGCDEESLESEIVIGETKVELIEEEPSIQEGSADEAAVDNEPSQEQQENFECPKCQKICKTKKGLRHHRMYCGGHNKFLQLPPTDVLKDQLEKRGTIETFQCEKHCKKLFFSVPAKLHHERICEENARNMDCPTCGRHFKNRGHLRAHQWSMHEENAKIYPCGVCGRMFKKISGVNSHMKSHSVVKPNKCAFCHQRYKDKKSLLNHVRAKHAEEGVTNDL